MTESVVRPVLEREGRAVAAVSGCLGVRRFRFVLDGAADHAGATPMPGRRDPARAEAQAVAAIADAAEAVGGLATVGVLEATPAIPTAIPRSCTLTLDLRHADADQLAALDPNRVEVQLPACDHHCLVAVRSALGQAARA